MLSDRNQSLANLHNVAFAYEYAGYRSALRRTDCRFHFHGFNNKQRLPFGNDITRSNIDFEYVYGKNCRDGITAGGWRRDSSSRLYVSQLTTLGDFDRIRLAIDSYGIDGLRWVWCGGRYQR